MNIIVNLYDQKELIILELGGTLIEKEQKYIYQITFLIIFFLIWVWLLSALS